MNSGAKEGVGKTQGPLIGAQVRVLSATNRAAPMLKRSQLATGGQGFSDSLLQGIANSPLSRKSVKNLTKLQRRVLNEIIDHSASDNFLSRRDLERILPDEISKIDDALTCLRNLGLINCARAEGTLYFCPSDRFLILKKQVHALAIISKTEREIINIVRESLSRLYPGALASDSEGFFGSDEGRGFDIVFTFNSCVMDKQFFVADVFTRISVTKQIVQNFSKKVKLTCNRSKQRFHGDMVRCHPPRGNTLGMLICNATTRRAGETASEHDVSLLHFSDIQPCYDQVRKLAGLIQTMC